MLDTLHLKQYGTFKRLGLTLLAWLAHFKQGETTWLKHQKDFLLQQKQARNYS